MAYFPNGTSGDIYMEQWCERCANWRETESDNWGCFVFDLHLAFNYEQNGESEINKLKHKILEHFIPTGEDLFPEKCKMFIERKEVDIPGQMTFEALKEGE